jgi:xanthine dehydrogenase accessory factor
MDGWVGGSCAQTVIAAEAQRALREGKARLVRLSPAVGDGGSSQPDVAEYLMTCHSGGTLEIFVEPVVPQPRLCVVGDTPVARTLAALGATLGYRVERIDPTADPDADSDATVRAALAPDRFAAPERTHVVVATMGASDEETLVAALRSQAPYVALVASPRRAAVLRDYLAARGVTAEQIARLRAPAGLNIGAQTQEEIALSILAEIVQLRSSTTGEPIPAAPAQPEAKDPVCGMIVSPHVARFTTDHEGTTYHFCCAHCKATFEAAPEQFATVGST